MRARLAVYSKRGDVFQGYLPFVSESLEFSDEVGGGGSCSWESLMSDIDATNAWDAVISVQLETSPGTWVPGPNYATRHSYTHRGGSRRFRLTAQALLEAWAGDAVVMPEYVVGSMPRGAGTERGVGWMSSAYDPADDPDEPWDACYETSRSTMPPFWPSGTGAQWISASGSSDETEAKYFRTWLTITGSKKSVEFYLSSDESATLWVAGERIVETSSTETGKKEYTKNTMVLYPGTYAVAVYTATHVTKDGGDGQDPILVAAAILDSDGDPSSWILASNEDDWVACRRDNEPPDDVPPGPTPGAVLRYLVGEAAQRNVCGWPNVTLGFTDTHDSYGVAWSDVSERLFAYGQTSYWDVFQSLAESDEVDTWMAGLTLHAAPHQGQPRALTFTETHFHTFATKGTSGAGSWVMAQAHDGWLTEKLAGYVRREYALELGEALTRSTGRKIAQASLRDRWRWDASGSLNPPQAGWIPYVDFRVGDWMAVDYQAVVHDVAVLSISATAGEGGLLFDLELTEFPIDTGSALGVAS